MEIRRLTLNDDIEAVAELFYATDDTVFPMVFGKKEKAVEYLSKLIKLEYNQFSYKKTHIFIEEDKIVGVLVGFDEREQNDKLENSEIIDALSTGQLMRLVMKASAVKKYRITYREKNIFIRLISVASDWKGKGIGTALLGYFRAIAQKQGYKQMSLDVPLGNKVAIGMCAKLGFRVVEKKSFGKTDGIQRMVLDI